MNAFISELFVDCLQADAVFVTSAVKTSLGVEFRPLINDCLIKCIIRFNYLFELSLYIFVDFNISDRYSI